MLISVDGTGSRDWMRTRKETQRFNSNVRNFSDDYVDDPATNPKKYFAGPALSAVDVPQIVQWGWEFALSNLRAQPGQTVNLIGHSRGGHIVTELASLLDQYGWLKFIPENECPPFWMTQDVTRQIAFDVLQKKYNIPDTLKAQQVNFLGLYDAVDRDLSYDTGTIPSNVVLTYHAVRDPAFGSRWYFGNTARTVAEDPFGRVYGTPPARYVEKIIMGSHGSLGGDPDGGDIKWGYRFDQTLPQTSARPAALQQCVTPVAISEGPIGFNKFGPPIRTYRYECDAVDENRKATLYAATAAADAFIRAGARSTGIRFK